MEHHKNRSKISPNGYRINNIVIDCTSHHVYIYIGDSENQYMIRVIPTIYLLILKSILVIHNITIVPNMDIKKKGYATFALANYVILSNGNLANKYNNN